ncbi:MOSC domain-containing protein [Roseobacter sp. YSTF-M11]|uniref:MOSC domain-containing protein n=1 Tax=Roseobacter insulae TaxID=2859783 RepID=A0A9X1FYF0_9RHOB|nr:MOSC N-terminal beta barrel domain-containing protein [Roseobacter insulae]MBW4709871.1 MOSC domain-containing protein [Roseobacter insulae]
MNIVHILRHPLKSHGREALSAVALRTGEAMPWDRVWAVAHDASKADGSAWAQCANFSRGSKAPQLLAISSTLDEATETLSLKHPDRPDLTFHPDTEGDRLIAWVSPLVPQDRALPDRILRLDGRGFTDSDFPSITLCNLASHRAVEQHLGRELSIHRWRGNLWFDGNLPWIEFDWMGRDIRIGDSVLRVRERTDRCLATTANPDTGERDADILGTLKHWNHQDFSVRAEVIQGGSIALGDPVTVL